MNRGIAKRPLFESRADMRYFLARLAHQVRAGRLELHAYCLMTTHFHLLVRSPVGEMSEGMRRLQNDYSRRFNRGHHRDGTLVRGRFFSRPVDGLRYRRVLVRYIDANPVRAGMTRAVGEYELGSAHDYLSRQGPPWLTRDWVEGEAASATGREFDGRSYLQTFGPWAEQDLEDAASLVEARNGSPAREDRLDDLVSTQPERVQAWMRSKARLADGCEIGAPVIGARTLLAELAESLERQGPWFVADGHRTWSGAELVTAGLGRTLCGLTWAELAARMQSSPARVMRLATAHARLTEDDRLHSQRTLNIASAALERVIRSRTLLHRPRNESAAQN